MNMAAYGDFKIKIDGDKIEFIDGNYNINADVMELKTKSGRIRAYKDINFNQSTVNFKTRENAVFKADKNLNFNAVNIAFGSKSFVAHGKTKIKVSAARIIIKCGSSQIDLQTNGTIILKSSQITGGMEFVCPYGQPIYQG